MSVILEHTIDEVRRMASSKLDPERRSELGQFMTPSAIADFMASLFQFWPRHIRLLDPGAGVGSLTEAFVNVWKSRRTSGSQIDITAYEIDPLLIRFLNSRLRVLSQLVSNDSHVIASDVIERDFIAEATFALSFGGPRFTHVILNPPYRKIGATSEKRQLLRGVGIETVNLYSAFLALAIALCEQGGEIVAIIPRSFCNGTYFRPFREWFMERAALTHIHVFESRRRAFQDDDVLQENVIVRLVRGVRQGDVTVSNSLDASFSDYTQRSVPFQEVVYPTDGERYIRIPALDGNDTSDLFRFSLEELGLGVATGPVVDFRVKDNWLAMPVNGCAPLLYAHHFQKGVFQWPKEHRKPNALRVNSETTKWLMPRGWYTVTKRFSSKEEPRRVVSYVVDPNSLPGELYGFENHLNVIHCGKRELGEELARGIALFLNSTVVDNYFRTFSGHTQVNATDLRTMRFPSKETLVRFGRWAKSRCVLTQEIIDQYIDGYHAH